MSPTQLDVWTPQGFAGVLAHAGDHAFGYDVKAAPSVAVSLTMPVRLDPYRWPGLHPVFQMNLPEGYMLEQLRNRLAKATGTDPMLLLSLLGAEAPIGRLRIAHAGVGADGSIAPTVGERLGDILAHRGAQGLFDSLLDRYLMRSATSGVQPKVLVPERAGAGGPADGQAPRKAVAATGELIVKSGLDEFPGLAINEFVCMTVAQRAGIPVPEFHLSDDRKLFVLRRFDRTAAGQALGFEDMAVLAGKDAARKYDGRYEDIARLIAAFCSPDHAPAALRQLFDTVALSCILGNGDAHLKNFGLLYEHVEEGPVWLAPAYDIVNTTCYLPQDALALALAGNRSLFASRQTLLDFAPACRLSPARAWQRIGELIDAATEVLAEQADLAAEVPGFLPAVSAGLKLFQTSFARARLS